MSTSATIVPLRRKRRPCPICRRPAEPDYQPFCSKRCADIDLGRWLGGDYRIPAEEEAPSGESGPEQP